MRDAEISRAARRAIKPKLARGAERVTESAQCGPQSPTHTHGLTRKTHMFR